MLKQLISCPTGNGLCFFFQVTILAIHPVCVFHRIMTDIYRKPVPVMRKNEAPLELNRLDSSSSPVCDVGAVQGERSFLYARSVTQSSKKFGYATEVSLKNQKENNSALPNIFQPSG